MRLGRARVEQHIEKWGRVRRELARYAYHFTHLENAASILNTGELLSRAECVRRGIAHHDSASTAVISKTAQHTKTLVRLYFRPKTPTQLVIEGIRPPDEIDHTHQAHLPVPVFFAFGLANLLTQPGTMFSDGNMAHHDARCGDTVKLFESIPFENVFYDGKNERAPYPDRVRFHKCAEVLVPDSLRVDGVTEVICRSHAERRTLLQKLEQPAAWANRVRVGGTSYFFRKWAFVENVTGTPEGIDVQLHQPEKGQAISLGMNLSSNGKRWDWPVRTWSHHKLSEACHGAGDNGLLTIRIFGFEAFRATVHLSEAPY